MITRLYYFIVVLGFVLLGYSDPRWYGPAILFLVTYVTLGDD